MALPLPNPHLGLSLSLLSLFLILALFPQPIYSDSLSVYEILPKFGLPSGLLPSSVTSYSLSEDGTFTVNLEKSCYVQFDYLAYYEKKITGKLRYGCIANLKGIQVQRLFFWFNVDEIKVDLPPSDSIHFQVGVINKKLDVGQLKTVHSCRGKVNGGSCDGFRKQVFEHMLLGLISSRPISYFPSHSHSRSSRAQKCQQLEQELDLESLDVTAEEELVVIGCAGAHGKDGEGRTEARERENWIKAITFIE